MVIFNTTCKQTLQTLHTSEFLKHIFYNACFTFQTSTYFTAKCFVLRRFRIKILDKGVGSYDGHLWLFLLIEENGGTLL